MDGPAYLRVFFDVAQVDGVVEQEQQSVQGVSGQPVHAGLAGEEQRAASRPDHADETAHVGGETVFLAGGECQLGQAVDDDAADRVPGDVRAYGGSQDIKVQIAHRNIGNHELTQIAEGGQVPAEPCGHAGQLGTGVLEGDVQAVFPTF